MAAHQFGDLPQIPHGMGEPRYTSWGYESYSYTGSSYRPDNVHFRSEEDIYFEDFDNGAVNMQPMQRFMQDQYPLTHGVLHANIPTERHFFMQCEPQWSTADAFRNVSPDRTSGTSNSSYDLHSPNVYHAVPYGSPTEKFSPSTLPYPTADHFGDISQSAHPTLLGGSISLRELEYEHHEPELEPTTEDTNHVTLKQEAVVDHDHIIVEVKSTTSETTKEYADSGIGNSVRDAESVQPMDIQDFQDVPEDPASDSDYKPTSHGRSIKRRRSSATSNRSSTCVRSCALTKRTVSSHSKSNSSSKVMKRSRRVTIRTRRMSDAVKDHVETDDKRRAFPCPLAPYGCESTFSSKNEWKRHVSTQHVKLGFWRCDLCPPSTDAKDDRVLYYNDFNRKDLFSQHLRRMHAAPKHDPSRSQKDFPVNEDNLSDHQTRCLLALRKAPQNSACLYCDKTFHGPTSWEDRMEHIGRHLEKDGSSIDLLDIKSWNKDDALEQYLLNEGLIARDHGEWKVGDGKRVRFDDDSDYESDEE